MPLTFAKATLAFSIVMSGGAAYSYPDFIQTAAASIIPQGIQPCPAVEQNSLRDTYHAMKLTPPERPEVLYVQDDNKKTCSIKVSRAWLNQKPL